jgi:hypothetical protein
LKGSATPLRSLLLVLFTFATVAAAFWLSPVGSAARAASVTYYVSSSGDDSHSGTSPSTAWLTIARVNSAALHPGDTVLFQGGATFTGLLYLGPGEGGTSSAPITLGSYGTGRATISGGTGTAISVYDVAGISIKNLIVVGSGATTSTTDGISFYNDLGGNTKLPYILIDGVDVSGFGDYGILIGAWNGASGFQNVTVTNSTIHDNARGGFSTYGPPFQPASPSYALANVYVGHVTAYNNRGVATDRNRNSGSGIVLGSVSGATVERAVAHDNGALCPASGCGVGIWTYDSTAVTIQYNESYNNRTGSTVDGDGFDLDQNTSKSFLQYNYSHGNDGAGYLLYTGQANSAWTGNTVRYNISQNDGRKNSYGSIFIGGRVYGTAVYNNTLYIAPAPSGSPPAFRILSVGSGNTVRNNVIYAVGGLRMISAPAVSTAALIFQQNDYFSPSGAYSFAWGAQRYTSLTAWRTATGQEKLTGKTVGLTVDPKLTSPGGGGTFGNADLLANLTAYFLQPATPLRDIGLALGGFGINPGGHDYYGVAVPTGAGPEIGASELSQLIPPPRLRSAPGWHVISTGPTSPPSAAQVLAATIPIRRDPGGANALPLSTLKALPSAGIIVQAGIYGRGVMKNSPPRPLPLTIRGRPIYHGFEGVPRRYAYTVVLARVHGWDVEVYVWFGRSSPTIAQRSRADAEVRRIVIPAP